MPHYRTCQDAERIGLQLPAIVLQEAVRRNFFALLRTGSIASAVTSLDLAADMPSGIKLMGTMPEMQSTAQYELARDAIGVLFEKSDADAEDVGDLQSLVTQLHKVVQHPMLKKFCESLLRVIQASALSDSVVQEALDYLMHDAPSDFKQKLAYPRARSLVDLARRLVLQRSIDSSLQGELTDIRGEIDRVAWAAPTDTNEQVLVNARFNASLLSKARLRLEGVLAKASDKMKADRSNDIMHIHAALKESAGTIKQMQTNTYWSLMEKSLAFLAQVLKGAGDFNIDEQLKVHTGLREQTFGLCLTNTADFGLVHLLGGESAQHDELLDNLQKFKATVSEFVQTLEKGERPDFFSGVAEKFWSTASGIGLLNPACTGILAGTSDHTRLCSAFAAICVAYSAAASERLQTVLDNHEWFLNLIKGLVNNAKDPIPASLGLIDIEAIELATAQIQAATSVMEEVGDFSLPLVASSLGIGIFKLFGKLADLINQREAFINQRRAVKKKADIKHMQKIVDILPQFMLVLDVVLCAAPKKLQSVLEAEQKAAIDFLADVFSNGCKAWGEMAQKTFRLAAGDDLETSELWDAEAIDETALLELCNCPAARDLREQWQALVAWGDFAAEFAEAFEAVPLRDAFFDKLGQQANLEELNYKYKVSRDKVSEFVAIRALYRPLRPNEQRPRVLSSARQTIKDLGGELPAKLGMLLN